MEKALPAIPAKRYFTIGEVSELCGVKPYVLRYWEQEFTQLKPMKRRGNRRYYQHHEVLLIRRIRELLYEQGFTISGARNRLTSWSRRRDKTPRAGEVMPTASPRSRSSAGDASPTASDSAPTDERRTESQRLAVDAASRSRSVTLSPAQVRQELLSIRGLLAAVRRRAYNPRLTGRSAAW